MDLYSLIVEHQGRSFSTQLAAPSAHEAIAGFFSNTYANLREQAFGSAAPDLSSGDIVYVQPMTDLINIWTASVGRGGQYVSIICVLTAARSAA
jgi:hypothetical protein